MLIHAVQNMKNAYIWKLCRVIIKITQNLFKNLFIWFQLSGEEAIYEALVKKSDSFSGNLLRFIGVFFPNWKFLSRSQLPICIRYYHCNFQVSTRVFCEGLFIYNVNDLTEYKYKIFWFWMHFYNIITVLLWHQKIACCLKTFPPKKVWQRAS